MKRTILLGLLMMALIPAAPARAQRALDTLYFRTESNNDAPVRLRFGIDPEYTDSLDYKGPEFEIPGAPPAFYGAFIFPPETHDTRIMNADIRGIPDSVLSGKARRFTVDYYPVAYRSGAEGQVLITEFIRALTSHIDSVNLKDLITEGLVVDHTFTELGGTYVVQNSGVDKFHMRVYFNLDIAKVLADAAEQSIDRNLPIVPNPARSGQPVFVSERLPAGARLVVTDMLGNSTELVRTAEEQSSLHFDLPDLGSGMYLVRVVSATGEVLRSGRLLLAN